MARALVQNVSSRRRISGASTLAMQVARLQRPGARTYARKAVEAAGELRMMYSQFDSMARGTATGFGNPARHQEKVFDLLDEARALAGY